MFQVKEGDSIILASESTRRVDILRTLGISFSIIPPNIDEKRKKDETPKDFVLRISFEKANKVGNLFSDKWVIGADTVVVIKNKILGKPKNERDAFNMLKYLSGKWHKVITGYCVLNASKNVIYRDAVETRVYLRDLTEDEIARYIKTSEPFDKAGSYAVQGKGGYMVKEIKGSYANVVGLPICEVAEALLSLGVLS
ncbi:MAG TPA: Maf family protein [Syntrophorhabdaceae bacterium]|jgi:septum formation protein|nr:septum formation protein Maf [Syntrophorhabdaceae bacterium]MDI9559996.1 Maf family protein [Pseudomonadota bacterium]MBP8699431.1 septum formation protein Maf [Syntrophorhabdaceae bacterium]HPH41380.1 Maf family protein [Syntrophorhabdaceae bacterium]HPN98170.1 Maf family protein [Syntrophorhabdaceae bacterium]